MTPRSALDINNNDGTTFEKPVTYDARLAIIKARIGDQRGVTRKNLRCILKIKPTLSESIFRSSGYRLIERKCVKTKIERST